MTLFGFNRLRVWEGGVRILVRGKQRPGSFVTSMIRPTTTYLVLESLSLEQHTFGTVVATRRAIRRERLSIKDMAQSGSRPPAKTRVEDGNTA